MKIALVTQYFWPESFIINDMVKLLALDGHTIEVFTGKPNYPKGDIFDGYDAKGCISEYFEKTVKVHRVPIIARGSGGAKRLILNYLSFAVNGSRWFKNFLNHNDFDVIFVFAPSPILSAIPAIFLKKRLNIPLVIWIQDLWPESLRATGFIKNKRLLGFVGRIVTWIYSKADTLLIQSEAFKKSVINYTSEDKIVYYPNSHPELISAPIDNTNDFKELLSVLEQNRCFVFAGNLGTAQSLDTIIDAAEKLKQVSDIKIILVGSGSMMAWIKEQLAEKNLDNVLLPGRFPSDIMPHIFCRATGLLVTLKRDEIFSYTVPSKIQAYLAAGRPIIAALDGEGARIINMAGAGFTGPAEDSELLAANMLKLYHLPSGERDLISRSARDYFLQNFEMTLQCKRFIKILEETIRKQEKVI